MNEGIFALSGLAVGSLFTILINKQKQKHDDKTIGKKLKILKLEELINTLLLI